VKPVGPSFAAAYTSVQGKENRPAIAEMAGGHLSQVTVTAGEAGGPVVAGEAAVAYLGGVFG
jgi:hypothetical protein